MKSSKLIIVSIVFLLAFKINSIAINYTDVDDNYWAKNAISEMAKKGYLLGTSEGKYNPNKIIDKFEMSSVLAKLSGYKDEFLDSSMTTADKKYNDDAYRIYGGLLRMYRRNFDMWEGIYDKEIAYLLKKGIITQNDLAQFVVKYANGKEVKRYLKKEDLAVFVARYLDLKPTLNVEKFKDDADITSGKKGYVYALKNEGILNGNDYNELKPNSFINKAVLAAFLNKVIKYEEGLNNDVTSNIKKPEYYIKGIYILENNSKLIINNEEYTVNNNTKYSRNGNELSIYDLRLNYKVDFNIKNDIITKVIIKE